MEKILDQRTCPVSWLRQLVAIPSVNPMGREASGPEFLETRLSAFLLQQLRDLGLEVEQQEVSPGRTNVLGRLEGTSRLLMLEAHQDTVPVVGMTIPPFDPREIEGRIYGRGSCDIKGGMACILAAVARLKEASAERRPTIVAAFTVNEEHGFSGAKKLAKSWQEGSSLLAPRPPDAVIVAEPTSLQAVPTHKGVVRWRCHTRGKAVHSSSPQLGENAIYKMAHVLAVLESHALELRQREADRWLGPPSLSVGTIAGGVSVNTVPDACCIEIDRRILPGEQPALVQREIISLLEQRLDEKTKAALHHEAPGIVSPGLALGNNQSLAEALANVAAEFGGLPGQKGVPYGTDAAALSPFAPTVVFGPGHIDQAHTCDEWVAIEQLEKAAEIYYQFALRFGE